MPSAKILLQRISPEPVIFSSSFLVQWNYQLFYPSHLHLFALCILEIICQLSATKRFPLLVWKTSIYLKPSLGSDLKLWSTNNIKRKILTTILLKSFLTLLGFPAFKIHVRFLNFIIFRAVFSHDWAPHGNELDSAASSLGMAEWINRKSTICLHSSMSRNTFTALFVLPQGPDISYSSCLKISRILMASILGYLCLCEGSVVSRRIGRVWNMSWLLTSTQSKHWGSRVPTSPSWNVHIHLYSQSATSEDRRTTSDIRKYVLFFKNSSSSGREIKTSSRKKRDEVVWGEGTKSRAIISLNL